jgi:hypothetical protein
MGPVEPMVRIIQLPPPGVAADRVGLMVQLAVQQIGKELVETVDYMAGAVVKELQKIYMTRLRKDIT